MTKAIQFQFQEQKQVLRSTCKARYSPLSPPPDPNAIPSPASPELEIATPESLHRAPVHSNFALATKKRLSLDKPRKKAQERTPQNPLAVEIRERFVWRLKAQDTGVKETFETIIQEIQTTSSSKQNTFPVAATGSVSSGWNSSRDMQESAQDSRRDANPSRGTSSGSQTSSTQIHAGSETQIHAGLSSGITFTTSSSPDQA